MRSSSIQQLEISPKKVSAGTISHQPTVRFWVDGNDTAGVSGTVVGISYPYEPSEEIGSCFALEQMQIPMVAQAAKNGFERFRKTSRADRIVILRKLAEQIKTHADDLATLITREVGKPIVLSQNEVSRAEQICLDYAEELSRYSPQTIVTPDGRQARVELFPVGPVLAITPFNFPLNLVMHKLAPAIAAGCSIVIKPALQSPLTALMLAKFSVEAGYDAISVVPADSNVSEELVTHPVFRKISFTGSDKVGWRIRQIAGAKDVTLELGGNAAVIIDEIPEDPAAVADRIAFGAYAYSGQICVSIQRILVRHDILPYFQPILIEAIRKLRVGDPTKDDTIVGPLISLDALQKARGVLREAISRGANVLYGGNTYNVYTMNPTLIDRVNNDMRILQEEAFAPIATLETYDKFENAVEAVNESPYGLQTGVYTSSPEKIEYAFERLDVGGVNINDIPTYRCDKLPYGGMKRSGLGREGVMSGLGGMSVTKTLVLKSTKQ